jgi:hypothetical protein
MKLSHQRNALAVAFVQEKRTERLRYIVLNVAKLLAKNMLKPCVTIALDSARTSEEDANNSRDRCLIYIRSLIYIIIYIYVYYIYIYSRRVFNNYIIILS